MIYQKKRHYRTQPGNPVAAEELVVGCQTLIPNAANRSLALLNINTRVTYNSPKVFNSSLYTHMLDKIR